MKRILLLLSAMFFASAAQAQPYVFAGAAWTYGFDDDRSDLFLQPGVGYRFSRHVAVEAAYFGPGEVSKTEIRQPSAPGVVSVTQRALELNGGRISIVGSFPVAEGLDLFGTASLYQLKGERRETDVVNGAATAERSFSESDFTWGFGFGIAAPLRKSLEFRAAIEWIMQKDDLFGPGVELPTIRTPSLSLLYKF